MAVPHYFYLLLKMPGKTGILTFRSDLKKLYDCDQEAIEYATTSCLPEPSTEVFAIAQKLTDSELEISSQRPSQWNPTPAMLASRPSSCKKATRSRLL
jgi:hypothetical protein